MRMIPGERFSPLKARMHLRELSFAQPQPLAVRWRTIHLSMLVIDAQMISGTQKKGHGAFELCRCRGKKVPKAAESKPMMEAAVQPISG